LVLQGQRCMDATCLQLLLLLLLLQEEYTLLLLLQLQLKHRLPQLHSTLQEQHRHMECSIS